MKNDEIKEQLAKFYGALTIALLLQTVFILFALKHIEAKIGAENCAVLSTEEK